MSFLEQNLGRYDTYLKQLREKGIPKISEQVQSLKYISDERFVDTFLLLLNNPDDPAITKEDIRFVIDSLLHFQPNKTKAIPDIDDQTSRQIFREMPLSISGPFTTSLTLLKKNLILAHRSLFSEYIYEPIWRMVIFVHLHRPGFLTELAEEGKVLPSHLSPEDAFDCLCNLGNRDKCLEMLESLSITPTVKKSIVESFDKRDKDAFCSIVNTEYIDLSPLKGICLTDELVSIIDKDSSGLKHLLKLGKLLLSRFHTPEKAAYEKDLEDVNTLAHKVEEAPKDNFKDLLDYLQTVTPLQDRLIYSHLADDIEFIKTLSPDERAIFEEVLHRPEGKVYYEHLVKEYMGGVDIITSDTHQAIDYNRFDHLFDKRTIDPNKAKYLGVTSPLFLTNGVWPDLVKYLYVNGYINRPDIPVFVYRMTGVNVGDVYIPQTIDWKKNEAELYYLCKELYGDQMPAAKVKGFFTFNNPNKFRDDAGGIQEMKNLITKLKETYQKKV